MKFLAIESLRISLKLNISAAREQQTVGLGLFNVFKLGIACGQSF